MCGPVQAARFGRPAVMKNVVNFLGKFTRNYEPVVIEPERLESFATGAERNNLISFDSRSVFLLRRADLNA